MRRFPKRVFFQDRCGSNVFANKTIHAAIKARKDRRGKRDHASSRRNRFDKKHQRIFLQLSLSLSLGLYCSHDREVEIAVSICPKTLSTREISSDRSRPPFFCLFLQRPVVERPRTACCWKNSMSSLLRSLTTQWRKYESEDLRKKSSNVDARVCNVFAAKLLRRQKMTLREKTRAAMDRELSRLSTSFPMTRSTSRSFRVSHFSWRKIRANLFGSLALARARARVAAPIKGVYASKRAVKRFAAFVYRGRDKAATISSIPPCMYVCINVYTLKILRIYSPRRNPRREQEFPWI